MKQYSLLIKFLLLLVGIVYGQEKSDVQSTGGCNDYVQMAMNGSLSIDVVDLYTHIVTVRSGANLTVFCSCSNRYSCWYSGPVQLVYARHLDEYFRFTDKCDTDDSNDCTIRQLNHIPSSDIYNQTTIYCEDPTDCSCHKAQLPICFNGTIAYALVVQVIHDDPSPPSTTTQPKPKTSPSPTTSSLSPPTTSRTPPVTSPVVLGVTVPVATLILIGLIILVVILLMLTVRKFKKQHTSFDCHNIRNPMSLNESLEHERAEISDESDPTNTQTHAEESVDKQKDEVLSRL